jgi:N-methylhydantoinase A
MVAEFSGLMSKKGLDPREFTLVPFGGAGPLLAGELAREFHIGQVLVPLEPGTLCAMGALLADIRNDYVASLHTALKEASAVDLRAVYESLRRSATEAMRDEEQGVAEWVLEYSADMRYVGQAYEIAVVIHEDDVREGGLAALTGRFHAEHRRVYGHADEEAAVELVTARARLTGRRAGPAPRPTPSAGGSVATGGRRTVQVNGARMEVRVLLRGHLRPGQRVRGPAIVEQADTTVLVPAGSLGIVDTLGNILIREDR